MNYGYITNELAKEMCFKIVDVLGGSDNHINMLLETARAETKLGEIADTTKYAGIGITQFDKIPFEDTKARTLIRTKKLVKDRLGIDIDLVMWEHLRYNPYLCFIFTRLFYLLRPNKIPATIEERAKYWKKWYNTKLGKGTVEHYLEANNV